MKTYNSRGAMTRLTRHAVSLRLVALGLVAFAAPAASAQQLPGMRAVDPTAPVRAARRAAGAASSSVRAAEQPSSDPAETPNETPVSLASRETAAPRAAGSPSARSAASAPAEANQASFQRETFDYDASARRDPFASLLKSSELRPAMSDLRLSTIVYDASGRNSVAIMRDVTTKDQYRVRVGQTLGRMRVARISAKEVLFTIEEFGFSRQESLTYADSTTTRKP